MEAKRHGYWVSDRSAGTFPKTKSVLTAPTPRVFHWGYIIFALAMAFAVGYTGILLYDATEDGVWHFVGIGLVVFGWFIMPAIYGFQHLDDLNRSARARKDLQSRPWQAWPVRTLDERGVDLLAPDGAVSRAFRVTDVPLTRVQVSPHQLLDPLTDGFGTLWICGDLRKDVVASLPGGGTCLLLKPRPMQKSTSARMNPVLSAAVDAAISGGVEDLLDDDP